MRGSDHYRKAEEIEERTVAQVDAYAAEKRPLTPADSLAVASAYARAQVHATLALAAATASVHVDQYRGPDSDEVNGWAAVTGHQPDPGPPTEDELTEHIALAIAADEDVHIVRTAHDLIENSRVSTVARVAARAALNPNSTED